MALYEVTTDNFTRIAQTSFDQVGLRERTDLQRLLKKQIDVILPNTLVITEEFGEWMEGTLAYVINQHDGRVALYTIRAEVYDELHAHRQEIETAFGETLSWTRRDTGKTSRIAFDVTAGGYKDEANWPTIQAAMIDAMVRLEKALSPFISQLRR